jgi:hypothetical protein
MIFLLKNILRDSLINKPLPGMLKSLVLKPRNKITLERIVPGMGLKGVLSWFLEC